MRYVASDYPNEEFDTFADLREYAEDISDSLNVPISWHFEDEYDDEDRVFELGFLMPRKGRTFVASTTDFDRAEVEQWLDTWLRGEIYHWFGWSPKIVKVTKSGPNPADISITDDEIGAQKHD